MKDPGMYWNQAHISIKKRLQDNIFPEGLRYDCKDGFGTPVLEESYLLIKKIASEEAINNHLVAGAGQRFPRLCLVAPPFASLTYAEPFWFESCSLTKKKALGKLGLFSW